MCNQRRWWIFTSNVTPTTIFFLHVPWTPDKIRLLVSGEKAEREDMREGGKVLTAIKTQPYLLPCRRFDCCCCCKFHVSLWTLWYRMCQHMFSCRAYDTSILNPSTLTFVGILVVRSILLTLIQCFTLCLHAWNHCSSFISYIVPYLVNACLTSSCRLFYMVVKVGHSHWGRNVGWGFSRIECWEGYLGPRGMR
jgi:hypothetical protein